MHLWFCPVPSENKTLGSTIIACSALTLNEHYISPITMIPWRKAAAESHLTSGLLLSSTALCNVNIQMSASTISLPCRAHRDCAYHKHWGSAPTPLRSPSSSASDEPLNKNSSTILKINTTPIQDVKKKRSSVFRAKPPPKLQAASFQNLPTELLLSIVSFLSPVSQASLALTCRSFALILGPSAWKDARVNGHASWVHHDEMLDVLQRDMSSEAWWRCPECTRYHTRRKICTKEGIIPTLQGLLDIKSRRDEMKSLKLGNPKDPIYVLDFYLLKSVMDRHRQGTPHGICLNSLRCRSTRDFPLSETTRMELKYEALPKIVLDRLLLQITYTFTPLRIMFVRNMAVTDISTLSFLRELNFWICGHLQSSAAVIQATAGQTLKSGILYCKYCPLQYSVNTAISPPSAKCKVIEIKTWYNMGQGQSAKDVKWKHLVRRGKGKRAYVWGKQNIAEAFERILCSTTEEFERQLERSDGAGSWYDPELKMRAYKTLPVNIAGRL